MQSSGVSDDDPGAQRRLPVGRLMLGLITVSALIVAVRHLTRTREAALLGEMRVAVDASAGGPTVGTDGGLPPEKWLPPEKSFHLCGKYCGDNWCNGRQMRETECAQVEQPAQPESCYDGCCMAHDRCCVAGHNQTDCNREMLGCSRECTAAAFRDRSLEHWLHCGAVLEAAMAAVQHCECGLCPTPPVSVTEALRPGWTDQQRQEYLGQRQRPGWVQLG